MRGPLLVIVSELISEWIEKGEVVDRYYNPGNYFEDVHLLLTNDDVPDPAVVQRLVGDAHMTVHNLPSTGMLTRSLGWQPRLLRRWARPAVRLATEIQPALVRCYGAHLNGICALEIRRAYGTPVIVSLHTLPRDPATPGASSMREFVEALVARRLSTTVLRGADVVLAVYESLVSYLESIGVRRVELAYNVLNERALRVKDEYALHDPVRIVSVGRLIPGKDPTNIIRAAASRANVQLTVIGDGPLAPRIESLVSQLDASSRIRMRKAVTNDEVVASLRDFDLFAVANDYVGLPKAVIEPMLAGLPLIANRGPHALVPELREDRCVLVDGTAEGYGAALDALIADELLRESFGRGARAWAEGVCAPAAAERRVTTIYDELLSLRL